MFRMCRLAMVPTYQKLQHVKRERQSYHNLTAGPEPAILDWYGHCVHLSVNKLGGYGGMFPQEKKYMIRHSDRSEAMFGLKLMLLESSS